ncbi:MAG: 30S ribosomal protein S17 [Chloroflexi bacterium]|nr:30S ribosomal protein S17 [Chloroflexota bacterium]
MTTESHVKVRVGRVISDKMDKTVVVAVERPYQHRKYKKILRRIRKYKAHNAGIAKAGDTVRIVETRPLSKEKRWRVAEVVTKGEIVVLPKEVVEAPPVEKLEPVEQVEPVEQQSAESPAGPGEGPEPKAAPPPAEDASPAQ